ncbi:hypothetical protein KDD30_18100 (plasmid) [Photobacterium sp. GJ3]|uniref:hypothetical protein n=1 Tax=Photobacterium sp. GJ3 TaxID=2829502 RepID=UPI001B8BF713|nr:hypothetical protein [Photobacterium sp. GJ3]QUJ70064.1 hypothetical protein KDD30_18100 [Photobacterium sp. GJ3]
MKLKSSRALSQYRSDRIRTLLLIASACILVLLILLQSPVILPPDVDTDTSSRQISDVHPLHVIVSSLPLAIVGFMGIRMLSLIPKKQADRVVEPEIATAYFLFFQALLATSLGAVYYDLLPTPFGLMLDRIPGAIALVSLYCIVLSEYVRPALGTKLLFPLNIYAVFSVVYWYWMTTAASGTADLSAYMLVQLLPILHLPLILLLYQGRWPDRPYYLAAFMCYGVAIGAESLDAEVWGMTQGIISGHCVKHVLAACAGGWVYLMLRQRLRRT